ncbi:hypothetical protein tb265_18150 [Gemmatimonadetes bacterium T265]|nr:hypothetical protein tb265_18150 [Gemmatimonadetes bacterium T265]
MPDPAAAGTADTGALSAVVADPVVSPAAACWQVGDLTPPSLPDPAAARAARLEARLAVYARYASAVAEEAAAIAVGDEARRAALTSVRGTTAEHYAELREAGQEMGGDFADVLTDALHELRHQDAVDDALGRRLRALRDATSVRDRVPALTAGAARVPQLDLRF